MLEAVSGNTIKGPNLEDEDNDDIIKPEQVQVQVKKIKASVFSRFLISNKFKDTQTHLNKIQFVLKCNVSQKSNFVICIERFSSEFKYYNP